MVTDETRACRVDSGTGLRRWLGPAERLQGVPWKDLLTPSSLSGVPLHPLQEEVRASLLGSLFLWW